MERIAALSGKVMGMSPQVWARHANPWSVYSRIACLPLLVAAIWSRTWIGAWSLIPIAAALLWIWLNPRVFPPPANTDNWASRGVMGERLWLNRRACPVPDHHAAWARGLAFASLVGLPPLVAGLWQLDLAMMLLGLSLTMLPKLWLVDRMGWLYRDMAASSRPQGQGTIDTAIDRDGGARS